MKEVLKEILLLKKFQFVYNQIVWIVTNNKMINVENIFYEFIEKNYFEAQILRVCRLSESTIRKKYPILSLTELIKDMGENIGAINKNWFIKYFRYGNGEFTWESIFRKNKVIDKSIINKDIKLLERVTKEIKKLRDKLTGHRDKNHRRFKYKVNEEIINNTIKEIERLAIKYETLLNRDGYGGLTPALDKWTYIFEVPWIKK